MVNYAAENDLLMEWLERSQHELTCGFFVLTPITVEIFDILFSHLVQKSDDIKPIESFVGWALYLPVRCIRKLHDHCGESCVIYCHECATIIRENMKGHAVPYLATIDYFNQHILL